MGERYLPSFNLHPTASLFIRGGFGQGYFIPVYIEYGLRIAGQIRVGRTYRKRANQFFNKAAGIIGGNVLEYCKERVQGLWNLRQKDQTLWDKVPLEP